jgi:PAS domain S-box-containing protein
MSIRHHDPAIAEAVAATVAVVDEVRHEAALLKTGALQNAIWNSANFSSIATDENGVIQLFNVGAERMLGYTALEVVDKITHADISDPQEMGARAKALSCELATPIEPGFEALVFKASRGIEDIYELTYVRKDGSRFPAVVSVTALRNAQSDIIGYLLIGTDNTARKRAEQELELFNRRLRDQQFYTRFLTESSIDALLTTNLGGIITDVNERMEALLGYSREELIGAPFKNYFTDPDRAEAGIQQALDGGRVTDYELTARARNGDETVVSYNATAFYGRDSQLQGVFVTARDLSELKRLERAVQDHNVELERSRVAAEKANLAKSDFLCSMSHKLRSPLNTILGFAQLMDSDDPPPTLAQTASVDQILRAGWDMQQLINEIVDLAQIESGAVVLSSEPTSLAEVLRECQAIIVPQGRKRGIRITFPQAHIPYFVEADRTRLKQVLISFLSNAIKFNRKNGSVFVDCALSTSEGAPERIRVSVGDTGAGIPPDTLRQLFQPFNRFEPERSTEESSGIGLAMNKRLVELMGGVIGVRSTVGLGSVFWFEFNLAAAPRLETDTAHASIVEVPVRHDVPLQSTLLYVEDNPANLKLIEQLIARSPHIRLLTAKEGLQGICLAGAHQPDVILMDINLPDVSGIEALKILREDPATAHIPVIALSADAMPRNIEKALQAGFFRYLTKPIRIKELTETLEVALELAALARGD